MEEIKPYCLYKNTNTRTKIFMEFCKEENKYIDYTRSFYLDLKDVPHVDSFIEFFDNKSDMFLR